MFRWLLWCWYAVIQGIASELLWDCLGVQVVARELLWGYLDVPLVARELLCGVTQS